MTRPVWLALAVALGGCTIPVDGQPKPGATPGIAHDGPRPDCQYHPDAGRKPYAEPKVVAADWDTPVKVGQPLMTACPEDAIEISRRNWRRRHLGVVLGRRDL